MPRSAGWRRTVGRMHEFLAGASSGREYATAGETGKFCQHAWFPINYFGIFEMKTKRKMVVLASCLVWAAAAWAGSSMQAGGWEAHVKVTMKDPKTGETKTLTDATNKMCLSQAFIDRDPYLKPAIDEDKAAKQGAKCSISDAQTSPGVASWKMSCTLKDGSTTDAHIKNTAGAKEMRSDITQYLTKDGEKMQMNILTTSRYIGACTDDMVKM